MEYSTMLQNLITQGIAIGIEVLGAILVWVIGSWLIRGVTGAVVRTLSAREVDTTLAWYLGSTIGVLLEIILAVAIFGFFGVETTTIAGLLAGEGIAVGAMWGACCRTWQQALSCYF